MINSAQQCSNLQSEAENAFINRQWARARELYTELFRSTELSIDILLNRAWSCYNQGDWYEAIADSGRVLKIDSNNIRALELRGTAYYVLGELLMSVNHYKQCLKLDPEHNGCKSGFKLANKLTKLLEKYENNFNTKNYNSGLQILYDIIGVDSEHPVIIPKVHINMTIIYKELKQYKEAKEYGEKLLQKDENNVEIIQILADIHMISEEYEQAVFKYRKLVDLTQGQKQHEINELLQRAEAALKQSKQKDYYKILGISRKATVKEIKKAYREGVSYLYIVLFIY